MPYTVRFNPTANSEQADIIPDATPFNDGVMTAAQAAKLAASGVTTLRSAYEQGVSALDDTLPVVAGKPLALSSATPSVGPLLHAENSSATPILDVVDNGMAPGGAVSQTIDTAVGHILAVGAQQSAFDSDYAWKTPHLAGNSAKPDIGRGPGAGAEPSVSLMGNDIAGLIDITTGTGPTGGNAIIATVDFALAYAVKPNVLISPANAAAAALPVAQQPFVDAGSVTPNSFDLVSGASGLDPTTEYMWTYHVID